MPAALLPPAPSSRVDVRRGTPAPEPTLEVGLRPDSTPWTSPLQHDTLKLELALRSTHTLAFHPDIGWVFHPGPNIDLRDLSGAHFGGSSPVGARHGRAGGMAATRAPGRSSTWVGSRD